LSKCTASRKTFQSLRVLSIHETPDESIRNEGLFIKVGDIPAMVEGMIAMLDGKHQLDMENVSRETRRRFSYPAVGLLLHQAHLAATSKQHS